MSALDRDGPGLAQGEVPACPCCGAQMELIPKSFGRKITIEDKDYYCNNPVCYWDSNNEHTD